MKGIEVSCKLGGDTFTLHRTGSYIRGNNREVSKVQREGYAATNESGKGKYHWIFIPDSVLGSFEWSSAGSSRVFNFVDVVIGPEYNKWKDEWWNEK